MDKQERDNWLAHYEASIPYAVNRYKNNVLAYCRREREKRKLVIKQETDKNAS